MEPREGDSMGVHKKGIPLSIVTCYIVGLYTTMNNWNFDLTFAEIFESHIYSQLEVFG